MTQLGWPELYVTQEMLQRQSGHYNTSCTDCHLGDGRARDKDKAHRGMLKALLIGHEGQVRAREKITKEALVLKDKADIWDLLPEEDLQGEPYPVRNILWHDRDPRTLNFDPRIAARTCGKRGCHPEELKQFVRTSMGTNYRQRTMRTWLKPHGPHNCGPSFADPPPPEKLKDSAFDLSPVAEISRQINLPFSAEQARAKQRYCNVCHAGCLDCHYSPSAEQGAHSFTRRPTSLGCAGWARGTSMCHPGAMQSRRGETYLGGSYSIPQGMKADVHLKEGIHCVDCHQSGPKGMGDILREATCQDCHLEAQQALGESPHKDMACATCHLEELRGYQLTVWGPGLVAGQDSPFKKYSLYYGVQKPPIIMKDQRGRWMAVKVWPHSLGNFSQEVPPGEGIRFRWPQDDSHQDALYVVGTVEVPGGRNNLHLLWIEIERASHPFGKARACGSCHRQDGTQLSTSEWEFMDYQGAQEPFRGTYKIVADSEGLKITGLRALGPVKVQEGYHIEDFAPWLYFPDRWHAPGDFSIRAEWDKYQSSLRLYEKAKRLLEGKKDRRLRELVFHSDEEARRLLSSSGYKNR